MGEIAIRVEGLSKQYRIGGKQERYRTLRDSLADAAVAPFRRVRSILRGHGAGLADGDSTIWALKEVSFEVKRGDVLGIIGRNGAGKSTLLKILSRITEPTKGYAEVHGRVGSLLEVGTGFHPELTGRENIYLNGAILGMKRAEIERKFDEIVAFAEVEQFIDTPVKHYSSGMHVRLAFAVAAHLEPEILLVDEVLAVGDAVFQKKCLAKMRDVAQEGRTVLFVSHNMNAVLNLCGRALWLDSGASKATADVQAAVSAYLSANLGGEQTSYFVNREPGPSAKAHIVGGGIEPAGCELTNGMQIAVTFRVQFYETCHCNFLLYVYREGALAFVSADHHAPTAPQPVLAGQLVDVIFRIPRYLLNPGFHAFGFAVVNRGGNSRRYAYVENVLPCLVLDDQVRRGGEYFLGWGGAVSPILPATLRGVPV